MVNNTNFSLVDLQLEPGTETDPMFLNFTYKCISFKPTYMEFQTYFNYLD